MKIRTLKLWWYKHFGKYKLVDTTKNRIISKKYQIFTLSEWQTNQVKDMYPEQYIFVPTPIGYVFKIVTNEGEIIDLTDYNTW